MAAEAHERLRPRLYTIRVVNAREFHLAPLRDAALLCVIRGWPLSRSACAAVLCEWLRAHLRAASMLASLPARLRPCAATHSLNRCPDPVYLHFAGVMGPRGSHPPVLIVRNESVVIWEAQYQAYSRVDIIADQQVLVVPVLGSLLSSVCMVLCRRCLLHALALVREAPTCPIIYLASCSLRCSRRCDSSAAFAFCTGLAWRVRDLVGLHQRRALRQQGLHVRADAQPQRNPVRSTSCVLQLFLLMFLLLLRVLCSTAVYERSPPVTHSGSVLWAAEGALE